MQARIESKVLLSTLSFHPFVFTTEYRGQGGQGAQG